MRHRLLALVAILVLAAAAGAQAPEPRPNILVAIADDWSWPYAGAYGCSWVRTPAFDRVAREGVLFTRAHSASPGCSPSRAALLTGRQPWELGPAGTHASSFPKELAVYPDAFEATGYQVGFTGKGWGPGNFRAGGRERNPAGPAVQGGEASEVRGIASTDYAANFRRFLAARPAGRPFCFWYGGQEPHRAFAAGAGIAAGKKPADVEVPPFLPDTPEVRSDLLDYAVEIEWFDRHLGLILKQLEEAGELDRTLVVVTSDNGMPFPRAKANLYEYGTHVPLAIRGPGFRGGRRVEAPVSLVSLAATFYAAAGVKSPGPLTGRRLAPDLAGAAEEPIFTGRERHSSARPENLGYPCRAVRTRDWLYIRNYAPERDPAGDSRGADGDAAGYYDIDDSPTKRLMIQRRDDPAVRALFHLAMGRRPAEELFGLRQDPAAMRNLAGLPEHAAVQGRLRERLEQHLKDTGDPRAGANPEVWETYPRFSPIRTFGP